MHVGPAQVSVWAGSARWTLWGAGGSVGLSSCDLQLQDRKKNVLQLFCSACYNEAQKSLLNAQPGFMAAACESSGGKAYLFIYLFLMVAMCL